MLKSHETTQTAHRVSFQTNPLFLILLLYFFYCGTVPLYSPRLLTLRQCMFDIFATAVSTN